MYGATGIQDLFQHRRSMSRSISTSGRHANQRSPLIGRNKDVLKQCADEQEQAKYLLLCKPLLTVL